MFELFVLGGLVAALFQFMGTPKGRKASKDLPMWLKIAFFATIYIMLVSL